MANDVEVIWQVGNLCNAHCPYCLNAGELERDPRNISLHETKLAVAALNNIPIWILQILGGEPTCFDHMDYIIANSVCRDIQLTTNGIRDDVLANLAQTAVDTEHTLHVHLSTHPSIVEADPMAYRQRVQHLMNLHTNGQLDLCFVIMIDGFRQPSAEYIAFCQWLVDQGYLNGKYDVTFIRSVSESRERQAVELVRAYTNAKALPKVIQQKLLGYRADILRPNPWLNKRCAHFRHRFTLQMDGHMISSDCPLKHRSKRSVYDPGFNWMDEVITCVCDQPYMVCNGCCMSAHTVPDYDIVTAEMMHKYLAMW